MNTDRFKQKLEEEQQTIEAELATVGRPNPDKPGQWQATAGGFDAVAEEPEEQAQKFGEEENNEAIVAALQARLADITRALGKLTDGTYGVCEVSGEPIEEDRLEVNPAARTCKAHLAEEKNLPA